MRFTGTFRTKRDAAKFIAAEVLDDLNKVKGTFDFVGSGKYRKTSLGTVLYFSSEDELKRLFETYFHIDQLKTIQIPSQNSTHTAIYVLMKGKKELYATES